MRRLTGIVRLLAAAFCALAFFGAPSVQAETAALSDVRLGTNAGATRFVLEFDRALPYQVFTLTDPDRVVIDLPAVDWNGPRPESVPPTGLIERFRHGLYRPGVARVVLDLSAPAAVAKHFTLNPQGDKGARLVIDLTPASRTERLTQPLASSGWAAYQDRLAQASPVISSVVPEPGTGSDRRIVVLDPGHGGVDPGAIGISGMYEKTVVLKFAKVLKAALDATGRYTVVLTRDRDIFIPLRDRYQVAHRADAGLFVSLHADSHKNRNLTGLSVYTLSEKASDKEAEALAKKENRSDLLAGTDLTGYEEDVTSILISLAQQSVMKSGSQFAETLVDTMSPSVKLLRNPHRYAGFAVLKSPNVPSVLVELGYLSNRGEEKLLATTAHHKKIAGRMVEAIDRFFDEAERLERS